ncbi:MAG TPA: NADH-quinone oxidoreductase subunit C, partial [Hyphomicrobiaceae bacterium]|nr:NADH-quinone oxidoreductase subunit C [Hyphomicrobiaceae bacterium]
MTFLSALASKGSRVWAQRPWPRVVVDQPTWRQTVVGLAAGEATLLGLWSDGEAVHMALHGPEAPEVLVVSAPCPARRFPSVAIAHPPALRLERMIWDLYGLEPVDSPDRRPWLDHGRWGMRHPLGAAEPVPAEGKTYPF